MSRLTVVPMDVPAAPAEHRNGSRNGTGNGSANGHPASDSPRSFFSAPEWIQLDAAESLKPWLRRAFENPPPMALVVIGFAASAGLLAVILLT